MTVERVIVVGSGIVGTTVAYLLSRRGIKVEIFEKGPDYPYPHEAQFWETAVMLRPLAEEFQTAADLKGHTFSGTWKRNLESERFMNVGGGAVRWEAITLRMRPNDFRRRSLFGYGVDWPLTYAELEPFYCRAEQFLGVSGTDEDNPFAPRRSEPYPLPAFPLAYDDRILAERAARKGLLVHTTPQARTSRPYDDREACVNYRTCKYCPIGARYSPNYHLAKAVSSGLCRLRANTSVRRILVDKSGRARAVLFRNNDGVQDHEESADAIVLAAGTLESTRLLMMSKSSAHPDGLGNRSGWLGKGFTLHHIWRGSLRFDEALFPGRFGGWTGQSHQFLDPPAGGQHGGIKVELSSRNIVPPSRRATWRSSEDVLRDMEPIPFARQIAMHAESAPDDKSYLELSDRKDRFGDPFIHVNYWQSEFDYETFAAASDLARRFAAAVDAKESHFIDDPEVFDTAYHHMGAFRMGETERDGVVDTYGAVHGLPGLFVAGSGIFAGTSGPINPTLTIVALAIRSAERIAALA